DGRIGTGFIGTPALLPALLKIGEPSLAAAVFLQEEVPGWLYQVKNGATTIWERWDPNEAEPGFKHIVYEPLIIPQLSPVRAHHDSRAGRIEAAWTLDGDDVTYTV